MKRVIVKISGMSCQHCEKAVQHALLGVNGVKAVQVELANAWAIIDFDESVFQVKEVERAINEEGYDYLGLTD